MKWLTYILAVAFMLFFAPRVKSQAGNVNLHADPRLSVLIRKPHNVEQPTASSVVIKHKATGKVIHTDIIAGIPQPPAKSTKYVSIATSRPEKTTIVKPLTGVNGHAAGWSPPEIRKPRSVHSGKGYRVQIYNGPDRNKAIQIKTDFMRMYPGIRTYLTYISPGFRVKVGDYRNRSEAIGMFKEANSVYRPSMIVPDVINISTY